LVDIETRLNQIMESCEITESIAQSVCEHIQYCGNKILANGEIDEFICRKYMLEQNRHDKMQIIIPYTNNELKDSLQKFCKSHFEDCNNL